MRRALLILLLLAACHRPVVYRCPMGPPVPLPMAPLPTGYGERACGARPFQHVVERTGERSLTGDELLAFHRRHGMEWLRHKGGPEIEMVGLGGCCREGAANESCLAMRVRLDSAGFGDLFARLDAMLAADGLSDRAIALELSLIHPRTPRCSANDPMCGPAPHHDWGRCVDPRSVSRKRSPISFGVEDERQARAPDNACSHDGECVANGNNCAAWQIASSWSDLVLYPQLEHAMCGCVESRCRWFH